MKTLFDIIVAIVSLIVLFPIFILISVIIKTTSSGEVFYKGIRAGKNNVNFKIYKFRTMVQDAENIGGPSTALNDFRLTKIGRFLRKYKLDELPQFINIIVPGLITEENYNLILIVARIIMPYLLKSGP